MTSMKSAGQAKKLQLSSSSRLVTVRIELTPAAKGQVVAVSDRFGMTQIATLSRLIEWFAGQSEAVQNAVLWEDVEDRSPSVARMILEQMARSRMA